MIPTSDNRINEIIDWLTNTLSLTIIQFDIASSDASFRRYFRVTHSQGQHIVMDAPPEKEDLEPFIRIATLFKEVGLNVPRIYHQNLGQGFLLLEDFGSDCFLGQINNDNVTELYFSAFESLLQLQSSSSLLNKSFPWYDETLLSRELTIFYQWFLQEHLGLSISQHLQESVDQVLISAALEQPQVCVHRDFHSRNLMFLTENSPGIIDFQDAVIGPITYDLVSLLRDCYISWPNEKVLDWMTHYYQQITKQGLINTDLATFTRWFDLMGLQRHLKAIGIFSRLNLRDNKSDYLADIPRALHYVTDVCSKYPELKEFNYFLLDTILPRFKNKK